MYVGAVGNTYFIRRRDMSEYSIRTDLALESQESMKKNNMDLRGIKVYENKKKQGILVSTVSIETENAAKKMGRPKGKYITIEASQMADDDEDYHREVSEEFAEVLRQLLTEYRCNEESVCGEMSVLVVGLGNRAVTPDALGPRVVDNLFITRHIMKEFGKYAFGSETVNKISGLVPGVMAQTGMECVEIIKGVVLETNPDYVVTIDALAARSTKRLGRTIQLTNTGIVPGSGVGNHRNAINQESLGVPVISIGIPTVVDAATIVSDAVNTDRSVAKELMNPQLNGMFVTPKDIDETIKRLSFLISEGLNMAFMEE